MGVHFGAIVFLDDVVVGAFGRFAHLGIFNSMISRKCSNLPTGGIVMTVGVFAKLKMIAVV